MPTFSSLMEAATQSAWDDYPALTEPILSRVQGSLSCTVSGEAYGQGVTGTGQITPVNLTRILWGLKAATGIGSTFLPVAPFFWAPKINPLFPFSASGLPPSTQPVCSQAAAALGIWQLFLPSANFGTLQVKGQIGSGGYTPAYIGGGVTLVQLFDGSYATRAGASPPHFQLIGYFNSGDLQQKGSIVLADFKCPSWGQAAVSQQILNVQTGASGATWTFSGAVSFA